MKLICRIQTLDAIGLILIDHHSPLILNEEIQHVELIDLETALVLVCDDETRTESDNIDDQVERTIENKDVKVEKQKIMIDTVKIKNFEMKVISRDSLKILS